MNSSVVLYGKPGCHLCDDAKQSLLSAGVDFEEVDITGKSELESDYGVLVPVVTLDGRAVFMAGMNPLDLPELIGGNRTKLEDPDPRF